MQKRLSVPSATCTGSARFAHRAAGASKFSLGSDIAAVFHLQPVGLDGAKRAGRTDHARGDKSSYSNKQKRQAEHIEEGYEKRGVSKKKRSGAPGRPRTRCLAAGAERIGSRKAEDRSPARKGGRKGGRARRALVGGSVCFGSEGSATRARAELNGAPALDISV